MKDTYAEAEAVRAKYREDLSRKAQEAVKKPEPKEEAKPEPEPEVVEEKPPEVAKTIFEKVDKKRKKSAKRSAS